jgi:GAF domain-containing protein
VSYADLQGDLTESLDQQTATSEILRVISSSPTNVQPVFDTIAVSARHLCDALYSVVFRFEEGMITLVADDGASPEWIAAIRSAYPAPLGRSSVAAQAILERRVIAIADAQGGVEYPHVAERAKAIGYRSIISVPMLRGDTVFGAINVLRTEVLPFTDTQIALLQTFADQAVIAIENVRLFNETKEALDQQTATSEILSVISSSPTNIEPVFHAIVDSAVTLCGAALGYVVRVERDLVHVVAHRNYPPEAMAAAYPTPLSSANAPCRAIRDNAVIHVPDSEALDAGISPEGLRLARASGVRSYLAVPMRRQGSGLGAILVARRDPGPFSDKQIALLETFADQAVIAIENVRLFKELDARNKDLTVALEQQTATSEILRVISSSPTDVAPVFQAIVDSATRLCDSSFTGVYRFDGTLLHSAAISSTWRAAEPETAAAVERVFPTVPRGLIGVVLNEGTVIQSTDWPSDPRAEFSALARQIGHNTWLGVPMIRDGVRIGVICTSRRQSQAFTERQIAMMKTFADQAVIAIENVRLFTELQQKNEALTQAHAQVTESLEQQTAMADILRVISASPTDINPVVNTVARTAARLCDAVDASIHRLDGARLRVVAHHGPIPLAQTVLDEGWPLDAGSVTGRAIVEGGPVHVEDLASAEEFPVGRDYARRLGHRTVLAVPLLRQGMAIGAIVVRREEIRPFTGSQMELLQTFADQAVIAIENVRLFTELQASNRELTTALDTQTATSDILRVISRSQTDVQPVFDAIVESAVRLLRGFVAAMSRLAGDRLELVAFTSTDPVGDAAVRSAFPQALHSDWPHARVVRNRVLLNVADARNDSQLPEAIRKVAVVRGYQSLVVVPLLRHDEAIGAISLTRREPGEFTDDEISLLQTFADQAVIAIENARLLSELQARTQALTRSVGELQALGEIGQAISSTLDLQTVLSTIVSRANQLAGADGGSVYEYDEQSEAFHLRATDTLDDEVVVMARRTPVPRSEGVLGRMAVTREPVQIPDIAQEGAYRSPLREVLLRTGTRALLAVPLLREDHLIGGLTVNKKTPGEFSPEVIDLLKTFAAQSALAIQNARLFREIEAKGRQLEAASQHKSEFLANMSHELRTPLNAIIGFSEVLTERMFGELNEKQAEYLKDIHDSGTHLLSLINDILDLSKIEAGRMELEVTDFHLPTAIDNALTLVRERAGRRGITVQKTVDDRLGPIRADERKIRQVILNLLSNAIKFTPEGGRIEVKATQGDGAVEVSVSDTGVGIAPEDQEAVFEEFRQVGGADKKAEGTGLGLALSRKFVALHGGRIWVKSQVGAGSTFTFTIPVRL